MWNKFIAAVPHEIIIIIITQLSTTYTDPISQTPHPKM